MRWNCDIVLLTCIWRHRFIFIATLTRYLFEAANVTILIDHEFTQCCRCLWIYKLGLRSIKQWAVYRCVTLYYRQNRQILNVAVRCFADFITDATFSSKPLVVKCSSPRFAWWVKDNVINNHWMAVNIGWSKVLLDFGCEVFDFLDMMGLSRQNAAKDKKMPPENKMKF